MRNVKLQLHQIPMRSLNGHDNSTEASRGIQAWFEILVQAAVSSAARAKVLMGQRLRDVINVFNRVQHQSF